MNEHEKTPTVSHHSIITHPPEMNLGSPPYTNDGNEQDTSCQSNNTAAQDAPIATTAPQNTNIETDTNRMSGLSVDEEDEGSSTPKSCIPKRFIDIDQSNDGVVTAAPELPEGGNAATTATPISMPPVQEYSVLTTYDTNPSSSTTSGLPPRTGSSTATSTSVNKLRSPRYRSVKAVDWCPPSTFRTNTTASLAGNEARVGGGGSSTPTVVTSRAVRGDDATITTYATMTTMGDAVSILEGSEEESSSDDDDDDDSVQDSTAGRDADSSMLLDREHQENFLLSASVASGISDSVMRVDDRSVLSGMDLGSIFEHHDHEYGEDLVEERHVQVDKLPSMTSTPGTSVISGTTSKALADDRSLFSLGTANNVENAYVESTLVEVDKVPSMTSTPGTSVISGTTSKALRDPDDRSLYSLNTMHTAGLSVGVNASYNVRSNVVQVDKVPSMTSTPGTSVISGTTSKALRDPDDRSLYSLNTTNTAGVNVYDYKNTMVDRTPSNVASNISGNTQRSLMGDEDSDATFSTMNTTGKERAYSNSCQNQSVHMVDHVPGEEQGETASVSARTDGAVRTKEDQSVATWNTFTTGAINDNAVVDVLPSSKQSIVSGATNMAVNDDQSVATWNTMTTMNTTGNRGYSASHVVDHVPEEDVGEAASISAKTDGAVKNREDQSVATWNTFTTGAINDNDVVDVLPTSRQSVVSGTTNMAVNDEQSVATWNTMTTAGLAPSTVDRVPSLTNLAEASVSGTTNRAIRAPDDQSVVTFATQTTFGGDRNNRVVDHVPSVSNVLDSQSVSSRTEYAIGGSQSVATWTTMNTMGNQLTGNVVDHIPSFLLEDTAQSSAMSAPTTHAVQEDRSIISFATTTTSGERGIQHVVDGVPTFAGGGGGNSVVSGVTSQAVRMNDDRSITSFNTMTTSGDLGSIYEHGNKNAVDEDRRLSVATNQEGSEGEEYEVATAVSTSSRPVPSGILREGRHNRPPNASATPIGFNAGESVSNAHILRAITELSLHVDYRMEELSQANRRELERVIHVIQQEQAKRTALESRLHSQLLIQSESMVAMELKLLRLEAKVAHRELHRQRRQPGIGTMPVTDRLPPIAATSSPNRSDEEVDSFEELDLTPRANRQGPSSSSFPQGGTNRGPANIAVVTRSGASVASAVTATSFVDGLHDDERSGGSGSQDGDVEDMDDDQNDGSVSTPHSGSNNRISNLESILLNPLLPTGSNEQGISTRAVRGETDGNSSLPTSVTSTTMASTVVTATTRGESVGVGIMRLSSRASDEDMDNTRVQRRSVDRSRTHSDDTSAVDDTQQDHTRSRSQSPLTVQSAATETIGTQSVASVSVVPSILSTAAVASSRSFGTRRANAAMAALERSAEGRPLANRVVSFTTNDMEEQSAPPQEGGGDSITMPDELDTFSDVADAFGASARVWREEYDARLSNLERQLK